MSGRLSDPVANSRLSAEDAADVWLVRREGGYNVEADPAFAAWLAASPDNAKAWAQGVRVWERAGGAPEADPMLDAMRRDALMARPAAPWTGRLRIAAGVAIVLIGGALGWTTLAPRLRPAAQTSWVAAAAPADFSNGTALPRQVALADGSRVTLDAGSAIAVAFDGSHRGVRLLRGRAFFEVTHDPRHLFRVETDDRWVEDLGTAFGAQLSDGTVTVTLVAGKVSVGGRNAATNQALVPGQRLVITADGTERIRPMDPDAELAWRSGLLVFRETPLADAVAQINRYGGAPVSASGLGDLRVSGRFRAGDPRQFAHMLAEIYPLQVHDRPDGGAVLSGGASPKEQ